MSTSVDKAHLAIHGLEHGYGRCPKDQRGRSVQLGIGDNPSDASRTLAHDYLTGIGKDLDLIVGVNDPHLRFKNGRPVLSDDGQRILTGNYKGSGNTTRTYAQAKAEELGQGDTFAPVQIELSRVLRIPDPNPEKHPFPTQRDRELGAYLGFLFVRLATESARRL